jgi:hypothetical protein
MLVTVATYDPGSQAGYVLPSPQPFHDHTYMTPADDSSNLKHDI